MLNLITATDTATVYDTQALDDWGKVIRQELFSFKCRVSFNSKRETINTTTGEEVVYTATLSINQLVDIPSGAVIEFEDPLGNKHTKPIIAREFRRDLGGNILFMKLVV